jgi:hypothetical protein
MKPIHSHELEATNGGLWWIAATALTLAVLNTDWDKAGEDFMRGFNGE